MAQWNQQSLTSICECHNCQRGITTDAHSQQSHDQSLYQKIQFNHRTINITGGTTKCARTFLQYIGTAAQRSAQHSAATGVDSDVIDLTEGNGVVVELGAGTGLVSIACSQLHNTVIATDQQPLLELLQANIDSNKQSDIDATQKVQVCDLLWNDEPSIHSIQRILQQYTDSKVYIIGVDLIYARECISDLVHTYNKLCNKAGTVCYLVYISRFEWEKQFFGEMIERGFDSQCVYRIEDIEIWKFTRLPQT